jgi:hypothetical protein
VSHAQLGDVSFRINPSQVEWTYSVDTNVINTVGGRVIQILGVTEGDMVIQGLYGVDRSGRRPSWALAEEFQKKIAGLVEKQSRRPSMAQLAGTDKTPMHIPHRFFYDDTAEAEKSGLPGHRWDFSVYVKDLSDIDGSGEVIGHTTGKYSYGYQLTLFIVDDHTGRLKTVAQNSFLDRLANGVGWKQSRFNGPMGSAELKSYLEAQSPDGTIHGLVLQEFKTAGEGKNPAAGGGG